MEEKQILEEIESYKKLLTGDIFADGDIQQKIYDLKKQLNPAIVDNPELDDDICDSCGS
jgi:hypothetical protein